MKRNNFFLSRLIDFCRITGRTRIFKRKEKGMSTLNLSDFHSNLQTPTHSAGEQLSKAKQVKTLGIIALILAVIGIFVPFVPDRIAFILAKQALKTSREYLVPIEHERPAYWAYRIALTGIILWVVILLRVVL